MSYNLDINTLGILLTIIGSVWGLAWWLSNQFRDVRNLVYSKFDQLQNFFLDKLDYHEKHDDQRFNQISNDLWAIKLRNAAKDGNLTVIEKDK